jgi:hypothetical protein
MRGAYSTRRVPNRPKNIGRFRSDGDDPEGAVRKIGGRDIRGQAIFITALFDTAA